jgi:glutamate-ammonia-ligase adenylyltransferase
VIASQEILARLLAQLPDPRTPRLLCERLVHEQPQLAKLFEREPALLSDVLTLAAWSPLLATTLENNPDYVAWLQRERLLTRVRTREELGESLGRFALIKSQLDPHIVLARFRRRELLRTYLHDIRRTRTIVETTDELSSLADAVLDYALKLCRQELDNRYGAPQIVDSQGRISGAEFCVVALGKLGSCELNYASDIDLVFLFSEEGSTATGGSAGQITNREYFVKLAERLLRLVSDPKGEGASYRIDVRLRPHGREGALACSLGEAVNYYRRAAQDWELQTLIRARAAAGSDDLYAKFARQVGDRVFREDVSVSDALANVRLAKQKIDRQREREEKGFNVKLGRGGIREIEFIAQALQVAFGGRDSWLRAAHTLISLGRLADRGLITEREHTQLSDAYHFLRALEHRLQMEHGLQTHSLPVDEARREMVARRMNFSGAAALADFTVALNSHTQNVRAAFDRIFGDPWDTTEKPLDLPVPRPAAIDDVVPDPFAASAETMSAIFTKTKEAPDAQQAKDEFASTILEAARLSLNPARAISSATRVAIAWDKEPQPAKIVPAQVRKLVRLCGASDFFGDLIASRPALIHSLAIDKRRLDGISLDEFESTAAESSFGAALDELRRRWARWLLEIGARDAAGELDLPAVNRLLTDLAKATANASLLIAQRELERRYGTPSTDVRAAVLALGRLGSGGMDYGSDLDVIIVYESETDSPVAGLTSEQAYARLAEYCVTVLSSTTREGYLYRVDLRLRPDGQKGPLASGSRAFLNYVEKRAGIWEWLAYVKLSAVAGDEELGRRIELQARDAIHGLAKQTDVTQLCAEARRVRDRLEKEKVSLRKSGLNIKHGPGGMLDVYFASRYLQLRDNVPDDGQDRTTQTILARLRAAASISQSDYEKLSAGYALLRAVDHQLRLIVGRSATLPLREHPAFADIARRLNFESPVQLAGELTARMKEIREAYDHIMN